MIKLFVLTAFGSPLFNVQPKSNRIKVFFIFGCSMCFWCLGPCCVFFRVKKRSLKVERNKQQNQDSLPTNAAHKKCNQSLFSSDFVSLLFFAPHTVLFLYQIINFVSESFFRAVFNFVTEVRIKVSSRKVREDDFFKLCNFDFCSDIFCSASVTV